MTTVVRYRVRAGMADENERLVRAVSAELRALGPEGLRYAAFRLEDGLTFVHVASTDGDEPAPLSDFASFRRFREGLRGRCEHGPEVTPAALIGSYGMLD